jgi:nuclear pore complex protein Nup98-Nup96
MKKQDDLFEGLDEEESSDSSFIPRKNIKKLMIKPKAPTINNLVIDSHQHSRRSSTNGSLNGTDVKSSEIFKRGPYFDETLKYGNSRTTHHNGADQPNYESAQLANDYTNVSEDGGDNQSEEQSLPPPPPPHPANIVLERPGYFTIPPLSDLAEMTDSKGNCYAENFAIGRVDYGCITFLGVTNLANMNLDEIVHIRRKEVHVYPDESKKPPIGEGLNKPAEITLHRIWPTEKNANSNVRTLITDPNRIIKMGYNKKLEKATITMGAQFIDYDPSTGSWTFKVNSF